MDISSKEPPFFHLLVGTVAELNQRYERLRFKEEPSVVMRLLRGDDMSTSRLFFAQFAAALQFPLYFGKNMNALAECLADLGDWLPGDAYTLVISQATSVLHDESTDDFAAFFKLLSDVSKEWAVGTLPGANWERRPTPFHVALHVSAGEVDALRDTLAPIVGEITTINLAEDHPS
jgi:hypothetical protein